MDARGLARDIDRAQIEGAVIGPDHPAYDTARRIWNALADRRPAVIIRPHHAADVAKVIRIAAERDALLAVRGGGHSLPGLSTCDSGIMLDLSQMREVTVDPLARTAWVGGGALLADLDQAGLRHGLVTPAGIVSHTGVGGLTLGGGMGWLSRRFGLTIDNLLAAEIVTADGTVRQISAEREPDLFWAIRGGGGNFGIVTRFHFRMHPLGPCSVGTWHYRLDDSRAALRRYRDCLSDTPRELTTAFILTPADLMVTAVWSGAPDRAAAMLAPFGHLARPTVAEVGGMNFLDLQKRSDEHACWGRRVYAKGGYLAGIGDDVIDASAACIAGASLPDVEVYALQLGGVVAEIDEDATAYTGRAAAHYWITQALWADPADDARAIAWGRQAAAAMTRCSMRGNYVNEQSETGRDVAVGAYGQLKYDRLARLKARYDPGNLFRLNQNIEPKH